MFFLFVFFKTLLTLTKCVMMRWEILSPPSVLRCCLIKYPTALIPLVAMGIWERRWEIKIKL